MRWKATKIGDTRTRTIFTFIPYRHNDIWYWLEHLIVEEVYSESWGETFWYKEKVRPHE